MLVVLTKADSETRSREFRKMIPGSTSEHVEKVRQRGQKSIKGYIQEQVTL